MQCKHAVTTNYTGFELVDDNNFDVEAIDVEGHPHEPNAPNSNIQIAKYLTNLETNSKMPADSADRVLTNIIDLLEMHVTDIKKSLLNNSEFQGVSSQTQINEVFSNYSLSNTAEIFESSYARSTFYVKKCSIESPENLPWFRNSEN